MGDFNHNHHHCTRHTLTHQLLLEGLYRKFDAWPWGTMSMLIIEEGSQQKSSVKSIEQDLLSVLTLLPFLATWLYVITK